MPLTIPKHLAGLIPRGVGNKEIAEAAPFKESARGVVSAISLIEKEMGWWVEQIAVDAPASPPLTGSRVSENQLGEVGLSSFRTPPACAWSSIREQCINHLRLGGSVAKLPYANKIWMQFGFELFVHLKSGLTAEVIEVYPFAIVRALLPTCEHKSTENGYGDQLVAVAHRTGWEPQSLEGVLKSRVPGSRHDRLDAFMAAWVASLPREGRRAFGHARRPADAILVTS
ncbi:MAG: DUF429 domain-containing protein [Methylocystis sp.]